MEPSSSSTERTLPSTTEKSDIGPKILSMLESSSTQESILKKPVNTTTPQTSLIKMLPKTSIPLKTLAGPNGNIIVHGPHNKILSLQFKSPNITKSTSSAISVAFPKDIQANATRVPGLTLIPASTSKLNTMKEFTSTVTYSTQKSTATVATLSSNLSPSSSSKMSVLKNLEIKPITVTNSPKPLTPAQAATMPISLSQISRSISISKVSQTKMTDKLDNSLLSSLTETKPIEKLPTSSLNRIRVLYPSESLTHAVRATPINPAQMINLQISNGKLSDPNGPIKMLSVNENDTERNDTFIEKLSNESTNLVEDSCTEKKPDKEINPLIRVKSIETLLQANKNIKHNIRKQESLLKIKAIDELQRSPRTKGRSKSLTTCISRDYKKSRRSSACSDGAIRTRKRTSIDSDKSIKSKSSIEPENNALLCLEKIETSPSEEKSRSSNESLTISSSGSSSILLPSAPTLIDSIKSEIIDINPFEDTSSLEQIVSDENVNTDNRFERFDRFNILTWYNGIGVLKGSKLSFHFNEFGLIENVDNTKMEKEEKPDIVYHKPIFEREIKSQQTTEYNEPLYYCKGCHCHGAAIDFLAPDFCSHECIKKYNQKFGDGKSPKKYANRKKQILIRKDDQIVEGFTKTIYKNESTNKSSKTFSWENYLSATKSEEAPIHLFLNPFPCSANLFQLGMKLEAIDPDNNSLFCVCTVIEKKGYRLKLHFDGYSRYYDFWVNADSMDIFPVGWCSKTNRILQPPYGENPLSFNWPTYLSKTKSPPATRNLFTHLNSCSTSNPFKVGMKLEADDLSTGKVCVASVADVLDNRILVHFDGWDERYDYWIDIGSPYIHPVNWHKKQGFSIVAPPDYDNKFSWPEYLLNTKSAPAIDSMFSTRDPINFKTGMKLETVDKRNPGLLRPATIVMVDEYEIKILFDGWASEYAFWIEDDSPDIHPVGWCAVTGHDLEPPMGYENTNVKMSCGTPGCRGYGNFRRSDVTFHTELAACPYEISNWSRDIDRTGRLTKRFPSEVEPKNKRKSYHKANIQPPKRLKPSPPANIANNSNSTNNTIVSKSLETFVIDPSINICRQLLCDYGPRLQQVYSLWKINSECLKKNMNDLPITKNPLDWGTDEVAEYIQRIPKCFSLGENFRLQDINGSAFLSLKQTDLINVMNIRIGPAVKIYNQIVQLREESVTKFPLRIQKA